MYSELEVMSSEERIMNDNDNNKEIDGVLHYENYIVKYSDLVDAESNLEEMKADGKDITKKILRNYGFISPDLFVNTSNIYGVI